MVLNCGDSDVDIELMLNKTIEELATQCTVVSRSLHKTEQAVEIHMAVRVMERL